MLVASKEGIQEEGSQGRRAEAAKVEVSGQAGVATTSAACTWDSGGLGMEVRLAGVCLHVRVG